MGAAGESSTSPTVGPSSPSTKTRSVMSQSSTMAALARAAPTAKPLILRAAGGVTRATRGGSPRPLERPPPVLLGDGVVQRAIRLVQEVAHALPVDAVLVAIEVDGVDAAVAQIGGVDAQARRFGD